MRKMRLTVLTGLVVVFLFSVVTPIQAGPPKTDSGDFWYIGTGATERWAGCNLFLTITEVGVWTGIFTGSSTDAGKVVLHCNGDWSVNELITFDFVEVDGKSGGLILSILGSRPNGVANWYGHWVIMEGTGELANLRGQGNWYGPGAAGPGQWGLLNYDGKYHFEPN